MYKNRQFGIFQWCWDFIRGRNSSGKPNPCKFDGEIVKSSALVASSDHIDLYNHRSSVTEDDNFIQLAERAYQKLSELLECSFDHPLLGQRISIYVSFTTTISHVWKGYAHPKDPRPIIFLNPRVYGGAIKGSNATYIHEMVHLFTWRFYSHTLREGLADYLALEILPGAGVGPNFSGYRWAQELPREVLKYMGTTISPPRWLASDMQLREAYYFASYRYVRHLIECGGIKKFLMLYKSESPASELEQLYGLSREEVVDHLCITPQRCVS